MGLLTLDQVKTNFVLQHMLPVYFVTEQNVLKVTHCMFSDRLGKHFYPEKESTQTEHGAFVTQKRSVMTGSCAEGLAVPDHIRFSQGRETVVCRDMDEMSYTTNNWWFENPSSEICRLKLESGTTLFVEPLDDVTATNYAMLKVTSKYKQLSQLLGWPVRYDYLFNTTVVNDAMKSYREGVAQVTQKEDLENRCLEIHGPCATSFHTDPEGKPVSYTERDFCASLGLEGWPEAASSWPGRKRRSGWPSQELVESILEKGFHMVPVGRRGQKDVKLEWRYSFSVAEKLLAHNLSDVQRTAYVYLKLLHTHYFKEPGVLPTYCLKTMMFWVCEKRPKSFWSGLDLGSILQDLLSEIVHILVTQNLQHYFIPTANLLAQVPPVFAKNVAKKVLHVKRNLLHCLLSIDERIALIGLPRQKIAYLFGDFLFDANTDVINVKATKQAALKTLVGEYMRLLSGSQDINIDSAVTQLHNAVNIDRYFHLLYDLFQEISRRSTSMEQSQVDLLGYVIEQLFEICGETHRTETLLLAIVGLIKVDITSRKLQDEPKTIEALMEHVRAHLFTHLEKQQTQSEATSSGRSMEIEQMIQVSLAPDLMSKLVFPGSSCRDLYNYMLQLTLKDKIGVMI